MRRRSFFRVCFGFTLLELLVAAALAAVVVGAVAVLMGRGLRAWQEAQGRLGFLFLADRELNRLEEELHNAVAVAEGPLEGGNETISFVWARNSTHLTKVTYRLALDDAGRSLIREEAAFPPVSPEEIPPIPRTLIRRLKSFSLLYGYSGSGDSSQAIQWREAWGLSQGHLPRIVRLKLETESSAPAGGLAFFREIALPQGRLGTVEEAE